MKRAPFIPGCDPRHRLAVLALYRTLIREAYRVPLPDSRSSYGDRDSLSCLIRKRFASNRSCTSSRLVYAALAAGYRFIDVLTKASCSSSPEHERLIQYLQSHPTRPREPRQSVSQQPPAQSIRPGLLTKLTNPDGTYKYVPTNPPSKDPGWATRRLPRMGRTSESQTFLRFRKPQPVFLTRKLIKQRAITVRNVDKVKAVENEMMAAARDEDIWEELVARQFELEGHAISCRPDGIEASYRYGVAVSRLWHLWKWERRWYDLVARGDGHQAFLDDVLKMQEASATADSRRDCTMGVGPPQGLPLSKVKVARADNVYPLMAIVRRLTGRLPSGAEPDPFIAPYWSSLVESQHRKLAKMLPSLQSDH